MKTNPILLLLLSASSAFAQREPLPAADAYGYVLQRSPDAACAADWIDLSAGTPLALEAAGAADADDDGGAAIELPLPFGFYGTAYSHAVVSSNGYLALVGSAEAEDGGHWRADCPLPAIPDNRRAGFARIYALLADLERGPAGDLRWAHFPECPRVSALGGDACTVVQWQGWKRRGTDAYATMQVVLYHARGEIAVQYGSLDQDAAAQASFGIQNAGATSALLAGCGAGAPPPANGALCYFDEHPEEPALPDAVFEDGFELPETGP